MTPRPTGPADIARDVDEEIATHLELRSEEYIQRGMDPDAARQAAVLKFGNQDDVADACRLIDRRFRDQERRTGLLMDLRQDLGYALRMFRRTPGFATIAVLTLALGMGATTTIFTLANWALLRPVPGVADPANVSVIWVGQYSDRGSFRVSGLSYPNLADMSSRLQTLSIGGYQGCGAPVAGGGQRARNIAMHCVTASTPFDPVLWSLAAGALVIAAAIATIVPAHAATKMDVIETLRVT